MNNKTVEIEQALQQFKQDVSDCGLHVFSKKNSDTISQEKHQINIVRFNLFYRADSISWHIDTLIKQRKAIIVDLENSFPLYIKNPIHVISATKQQFYIFDDILFNLMSMYDYLAYMIGHMVNSKPLKWNGLFNSAKDKNHEIGKSDFAYLIIESHKNWVDGVMGIRSEIIHKNAKFGNAEIGLNRSFSLKTPEKLKKLIKNNSNGNYSDNLDIIDCSIFLANLAFISGSKLLKNIQQSY